jgi:hypothetical protein
MNHDVSIDRVLAAIIPSPRTPLADEDAPPCCVACSEERARERNRAAWRESRKKDLTDTSDRERMSS